MKTELKYIELKTNYEHNGPAWIGLTFLSKSGKTIYFNGKAFQRIGSDRVRGNYYDIETLEEYWISGVKKNTTDRHKFGKGKIMVEERVLNDYLKIIEATELDRTKFETCTVNEQIPTEKINVFLNGMIHKEEFDVNKRFDDHRNFTDKELDYFIDYFENDSKNSIHIKNRKLANNKMLELNEEREKRKTSANKKFCASGADGKTISG